MPFIDIKRIAVIFFSIIFLSFAFFYGFIPTEWICNYHDYIGLKNSCNIKPWVVILVSVGFFLLANITFREFNFDAIINGNNKN